MIYWGSGLQCKYLSCGEDRFSPPFYELSLCKRIYSLCTDAFLGFSDLSILFYPNIPFVGFHSPLVATMLLTLAVNSSYAKDSQAPTSTIDASSLSEKCYKVFTEDKRAHHHKVILYNRFGITMVGDLYTPANMKKGYKLRA